MNLIRLCWQGHVKLAEHLLRLAGRIPTGLTPAQERQVTFAAAWFLLGLVLGLLAGLLLG